MKPTEFQQLIVNTPVGNNETLFILTGRGSGVSEGIFMKLQNYERSVFFSTSSLKLIFDSFPSLHLDGVGDFTTNEIKFKNGSKVKLLPVNEIKAAANYTRGFNSIVTYNEPNWTHYRGNSPYYGQIVYCPPLDFVETIAPKLRGCYKIITGYNVYDNSALMDSNPHYVKELMNTPEKVQKYLFGEWK